MLWVELTSSKISTVECLEVWRTEFLQNYMILRLVSRVLNHQLHLVCLF